MAHTYRANTGDRARTILSRNAELCVIAVHSESVYARSRDGRLLLICPDKYGCVPFGIALSEYADFREKHHFSVGDPLKTTDGKFVLCEDQEIRFEHTSADAFKKSTHALPPEDAVLYCANYVRKNASARGIGPALPAFLCIGTPRDEANVYALSAAGEADRIEAAFLCTDDAALGCAIGRFIGLGYGLTPSGDDFLCGMLYAFHRYAVVCGRARDYLGMLKRAVCTRIGGTNEVSAEYIRCALDGEYFEVVERVLDCLSEESTDIESLDSALDRLLSVGASSGSDILCGMLFAVYLLW